MSIWVQLIMGGAAVAGVLALAFLWVGRKGAPSMYELGPISDQWIAQQRAHDRDSERV